ncbi:MAG TPA: pilus assembly protein PilP [Anaeromyxobacter sp.]|nr:pilus assembly protein PilP [Anaeromyxobacter sp.]
MNTRVVIAALSALALAACGSPTRPPQSTSAAAKTAAASTSSPGQAAAAQAEPEYSYSSVGKRDPFRSFLAELAQENTFSSHCSTPLGRYDIEQLKLVAVITGLEDPVAMVESPTGVGYTVRRGACIGKNGGTVAAVRSGEVVVSEWVVRADGSRDSTQTVLRLPKAVLNLEE